MRLEGNSLVEFIEALSTEAWLGSVTAEGCFKAYENLRMAMKSRILAPNVLESSIHGREDHSTR